jgi:hypothetical protein
MQSIHRSLARCAALATLALPALAQTTWYVDVSAPPPGNGTAASPYTEIKYAIQQPTTVHGDTLLVAPGTYDNFGTIQKALHIVSTSGPEVTRINGSVGLFGTPLTAPYYAHLKGFTVIVDSAPCGADFGVLERCVVLPANPPGTLAFRCGGFNLETDAIFLHCTIAGFDRGLEEAFPTKAGIILNDTIVDCVSSDAKTVDGYISAVYCYASKFGNSAASVSHAVVGPSPGVWDVPQGDANLLPLSICLDAGNPALPPDPDGSRADVGALPYDAQHVPHPSTYCAGFVHSGGCAPRIVWSGTPSLSGPDDFVISSSLSLNNVLGLFLVGGAAGSIPFSAGRICVAPPFVRGPVVSSGGSNGGPDCSGLFVWPVTQAYMQQQGWQPGQILYAQCWGRDPFSAFPEKSQLSNALVFKVEP